MMLKQFSVASLVVIVATIMFGCSGHAIANDMPLPTVPAKRGTLVLDDDGGKDRGGKTIIELDDGIGLKTALGSWERAAPKLKSGTPQR